METNNKNKSYTVSLLTQTFILCCGSSFPLGYHFTVLNQPSLFVKDFINRTYADRGQAISSDAVLSVWSVTTGVYCLGCMLGSLPCGYVARKLGRKGGVMVTHIPFIIGSVMQTVCVLIKSPEILIIGRFITGFSCGTSGQLVQLLISEISPTDSRGALGIWHSVFIVIGLFVGVLLGLSDILGKPDYWQYLLILAIIPAIISLLSYKFLAESPRYLLLEKKDQDATEKALQYLRNTNDVKDEMEQMLLAYASKGKQQKPYTIKQILTEKSLRLPLAIALLLQVGQDLCGHIAILAYSVSIFITAGVPEDFIQYAVLGPNFVYMVFNFISIFFIDKIGRRPLIIYPMAVMNIILVIITVSITMQDKYQWVSYISVVCCMLYMMLHAIGLAGIPWLITAELFEQGPRATAMSLAGFVKFGSILLILFTFEFVNKALRAYSFLLFLPLLITLTIFFFIKLPETKKKSLEEISSSNKKNTSVQV